MRYSCYLGLGLLGLIVVSCPATAALVPTTTTLTITPNPVVVGGASPAVTATVTPAPSVNGQLQINELRDAFGARVACGAVGATSVVVATLDPAAPGGSLTFNPDVSTIGSYGYWAHFEPAGSGYAQSQSGCVNLNVIPPPCSGLHISAVESDGAGLPTPPSYTGGFTVAVKNCGPGTAYGVTAQGGTAAWTTVTGTLPDSGTSVSVRKQAGGGNQILLWNIGDMAEDVTKTLKISLTGPIKQNTPDGTVLNISGNWSALSGGIKTEYTEKVTITVVNP